MITFDFETYPITGNTSWLPPKPVGVAIKHGNRRGRYYAWGHPTGNNCTLAQGKAALRAVWQQELLAHNGKFDVAVAIQHFKFKMPDPLKLHDTVFLLFLDDPYSPNLSLKPSAERLLDWPPEEQDKLTDWIMQNTACNSRKHAGAYIYLAPGDLVGRYAIGDVDRTKALYDYAYPKVKQRGMLPAYQVEQELMPISYASERQGVRVDRDRLGNDLEKFDTGLAKIEARLRKDMKVKHLDFDKANDVANALEAAGLVHTDDWVLTKTGRRSTSKENFPKAIKDQTLLNKLRYRSALANCIGTFAHPWYDLSGPDGRIHTSWNQVRTHEDKATNRESKGSRTGRFSASKPSLMNVPNEYDITLPRGMPPPPLMRRYLLPEQGHVWLKRDFNGQEIRILAHFEDGTLLQAYRANPNLDPHQMAQELVQGLIGLTLQRKDTKITAFSIVYGSGAENLGQQLKRPTEEARLIKSGYLEAFPGVEELQKLTRSLGKSGECIRTWGGREYYVEPAKLIKGRWVDFAYKLLNYLIQGSAADQTKNRLIEWWHSKPKEDVFLATVHDEFNISAPKKTWKHSMQHLRQVMDEELFDCPMRSEGFYGPNWFDIKETAA